MEASERAELTAIFSSEAAVEVAAEAALEAASEMALGAASEAASIVVSTLFFFGAVGRRSFGL